MTDDIDALTQEMMKSAIQYSAEKTELRSSQKVLDARSHGDCSVCEYLYYGLAKAIANYLGTVDEKAKAIYFYSEPLMPWDSQPADRPNLLPGFHIIVWTKTKSLALTKLGESLTDAVEKEARKLSCSKATDLCYRVNIALIDDLDVKTKLGYGALLTTHEQRPVEIWHRDAVIA